jgi:hypothetical protein
MAKINIGLADLFNEVFGVKDEAFKPRFYSLPEPKQQGMSGGVYNDCDEAGREYYLPVTLSVGDNKIPGTETTYAQALGVINDEGKLTGRLYLPYPVIRIELSTRIIDTELTERDGMVSELINMGGHKIFIKGFLVNTKNNDFPEEDFDRLNRLVNLKVPVKIDSVVTDILLKNNPDKLVTIRSLKFSEYPGVKNVRPYELELRSELPFSLIDIS